MSDVLRTPDDRFARHIEWTRSLVTRLDLRDITLVAQDWVTIAGAGHFLQEDAGAELGRVVAEVIATT